MILVIGMGVPGNGDDAAGLAVAQRIRESTRSGEVTVRELVGDQLALLDAWTGATQVYVVCTVCSGGSPGAVYEFDAADAMTGPFRRCGGYAFSLAALVELARALGRLPRHLAGFGIEGGAFTGAGLTPQAQTAVDNVTGLLLKELKAAV
jgi:hydrogenase maturation protease